MDETEGDALRIDANDIEFLCEQDGPVERRLKDALSDIFVSDRAVRRAYLVRIVDRRIGQEGAALCLSIKRRPLDPQLSERISDTFACLFGVDAFMDITELSRQTEHTVSRVAIPFYRRQGTIGRMFNRPRRYLVFDEGLYFEHPFLCTPLQRATVGSRRDGLLVRLSPFLHYADSDECERCTEYVILHARYKGRSVVRNHEWPLVVNVTVAQQPLDLSNGRLKQDDAGIIALGDLHKSRKAAQAKAKQVWDRHTKPFWRRDA